MLSGATLRAAATAGTAVLRIVVSNDSIKNATAISHGSNCLLDGGTDVTGAASGIAVRQQFANRSQFPPPFGRRLGIFQLEAAEGVQHNLRNNQAGILLVVGGNNVPRRVVCVSRAQASLVGFPVFIPEFPFMNVGQAQLPLLVRVVNALQQPLPLFFAR